MNPSGEWMRTAVVFWQDEKFSGKLAFDSSSFTKTYIAFKNKQL
jgi:hypothetical protein